jgi:hypothetical protein
MESAGTHAASVLAKGLHAHYFRVERGLLGALHLG